MVNTMRDNKPVFKPQDRIVWRDRVGYVMECINLNDTRDLAKQGYRYYVDSAGLRFSVTETELLGYNEATIAV
jgi:hypothetical protein